MKLQQLRYVCEIVRAGFNLTRAARALHTSQPGVSRYLQLLEGELGVPLFLRDKQRLVDLTPAGRAIAERAKHVVSEVENMQRIAREHRSGDIGQITVATAPGHARYSLPPVVARFIRRHPRVRLRLRQGYSSQIVEWVLSGEADLFVSTGSVEPSEDLALIACGEIHRIILVPARHALLAREDVTLADVARYPIITYDSEFASHSHIMRAFHAQRLEPNIVLSATDADVMKTYVRAGLGVAIVANTAWEGRHDRGLRSIDARHLFGSSVVHLGLRRNAYMSRPMAHFIELFAPQLCMAQVAHALSPRARSSEAPRARSR